MDPLTLGASLFGGGLNASSSANTGPVSSPVTITISGFGSKSTADVPAQATSEISPALASMPGWVIPALALLAVVYLWKGRK